MIIKEPGLSWFDKNVTPLTRAYKEFIREMEMTPPEQWYKDGERKLNDKENKFKKIYDSKNLIKWKLSGSDKQEIKKKIEAELKLKKYLSTKSIQENDYILTDNKITPQHKRQYPSSKDNMLNNVQLQDIPDYILGHYLSDKQKTRLASGVRIDILEIGKEDEFLVSLTRSNDGRICAFYPSGEEFYIKDFDIKFINKQIQNEMQNNEEFNQTNYLKDQIKYLGFGEDAKLHKDLEKGIKSTKQQFEIKTISDKTLPENKVDFTLKFSKSNNGGVFFNSYKAVLKTDNKDEVSHNFPVSKENTFTAKEAVNLLEGRSVKIEFLNPKTNEKESAFVKLDFTEPKTDKGNYNFQNFYQNYGINTALIVEKSNLVFDKPDYKDSTIKSLEKGNVVKVKFESNGNILEGKAVLNPQYKNLNLYDQQMNRINTNKPLESLGDDKKNEKNNVKEQSLKR